MFANFNEMKIKNPKYFEFKKAYHPYYMTMPIKVKAGELISEGRIRYIKESDIIKVKSISIANNLIIRTNRI